MRKYIIIGGFIVFFIIIVGAAIFMKPTQTPPEIIPTPTSGPTIELLDSVPKSGATDVKLTQEVVLTFSEPVTRNDITLLTGPDTQLFEAFRGRTVILRPRSQWATGSENRITVQYKDLSQIPDSVVFTTIGESPLTFPDTAPNPTQIQQSEELQLDSAPDVYLSNFTPHDTQTFTITSQFESTPTGHFAFIVVTRGEASLEVIKSEVEAWATGHGLSQTQFNSLDISYR